MTKIVRPALWKRATIDSALSIFRLIRLTNASGTVELRSPAKLCPECHKRAEVLVLPTHLCGDCWSRKIIASWRVPPMRLAACGAGHWMPSSRTPRNQ